MGSKQAGNIALGFYYSSSTVKNVGLRAEALMPCACEHEDAIAGKISLLEHMGSETIVYLDIELPPKHSLNIRVGRKDGGRLQAGSNLAVRPDWSRALFFDSWGKRLRPEAGCGGVLPLKAVAV
jgi:ABC-type sugar transport system ATPase subunit